MQRKNEMPSDSGSTKQDGCLRLTDEQNVGPAIIVQIIGKDALLAKILRAH